MTKDELVLAIRKMSVEELIDFAPLFSALADTANSLGKDLKGKSFNINMLDMGFNKIEAIKAIRELTNLGLKESKDLVESPTPVTILSNLNIEQAETAKKRLQASGMTVELEIC